MGTSLQVSTGDVSCYPAQMVKNLVHWSFTVAATKNGQSNCMCVSVGI